MTDEEDRYMRTGDVATLSKLTGDIAFDREPPGLGYPPEWWEARDREVAEQRELDAAGAERSRMLTRSGELRDNGFPLLALELALGDFDDTTAMARAKTFVEMAAHGLRRRILILAGSTGTGKSTAATWTALKGQDPRPGFVRAAELERRGRYDEKLTQWLKDKTSLVIDDLGTEVLDGKGVFVSLLNEIVDMFYANKRTLVITTNLRPRRSKNEDGTPNTNEQEQIIERYGERIWSRLAEVGEWADCGSNDLRRSKR